MSNNLATPVLKLENVSKSFPHPATNTRVVAIGDVSFEVQKGEFIAIVGPSGCGKTTLLRIIAGLIDQTEGEVHRDADKERTGLVFQSAYLQPWRTARQNIEYPMELKVRRSRFPTKADREARARKILELVNLQAYEDYYPGSLSGGMQQRVNLARALAIQPDLLLMDEPFSALDAQTREELQVELQRIAVEADSTTIFITHDTREAVFLADRVIVLSTPPSVVAEIIEIPHERPRTLEFQVSPEFNALNRRVWEAVRSRTEKDAVGVPA